MADSSLDVAVEQATRNEARDDTQAREPDAVRFEQAAVRLGTRTIWHDVTLSVRSGEFVAILGPNGAGKSTLLKTALGLLPLSEGRVSVLGRPVRRGNRDVSYLPQRRVFDSDVRVRGRDIVQLGLDGTRWGIALPAVRTLLGQGEAVREERNRVDRVIEQVGAAAYANQPIGEMSGGEQQRLLIAQALVTRPRLLLLDEPLEGLDLPNQQAIAALIRSIAVEEGVTVLLVAHDVNPILSALDRVIYVARGRAIIGAPDEIITTPTLTSLYGAPVEVLRASDGRLVVLGAAADLGQHAHDQDK